MVMNWKEYLKPTKGKFITIIVLLIGLYLFFQSTLTIPKLCTIGDDKCVSEIQNMRNQAAFEATIIYGIPLSIIVYIIFGVIKARKTTAN